MVGFYGLGLTAIEVARGQALVEYGALNSIMRDASVAMQRFGGWAAQNWLLVAIVLGVLMFLALRPRR